MMGVEDCQELIGYAGVDEFLEGRGEGCVVELSFGKLGYDGDWTEKADVFLADWPQFQGEFGEGLVIGKLKTWDFVDDSF